MPLPSTASTYVCSSNREGSLSLIWPPPHLAPRRMRACSSDTLRTQGVQSVFMPLIGLQCHKRKSSASNCALHSRAGAAPCVCSSVSPQEIPRPSYQDIDMETKSPIWRLGISKYFIGESGLGCKGSCFTKSLKTKTHNIHSTKVGPLKEEGVRTQWKGTYGMVHHNIDLVPNLDHPKIISLFQVLVTPRLVCLVRLWPRRKHV